MSSILTEEVFQEIYDYVKAQLSDLTLNPYGSSISPYEASSYLMPTIVMKQIRLSLDDETLSHDGQRFAMTIETNVYAENKVMTVAGEGQYEIVSSEVNRRKIANQISDLLFEILHNHFGLKLEDRKPIPNINPNVYRVYLRFAGKYDEAKTIYR